MSIDWADDAEKLDDELRKMQRARDAQRMKATMYHLVPRLGLLERDDLVDLYNAVVRQMMVTE